jgi:2-polyprenyl-3-methyl-5-hydroxy-6-metoxy-1,4-benzoquinol methylase
MIKRFLTKQKKILKGIYFSYIKKKGQVYEASKFWDASVYNQGISDRQTIDPNQSPYSAKYHYCSVEMIILKHLYNNTIDTTTSKVLDLGSGSGHWIEFYKLLGVEEISGIDVSEVSINYLDQKYSSDNHTTFYKGKILDIIKDFNETFNIVNAIGIMFHIVDDVEWRETINKIALLIPDNGIFIVGGHFGLMNGLNVQIDQFGKINKRLRSKSVWKKTLKNAGFSNVKFYKNNAYLWINDTLPENNVLIATK